MAIISDGFFREGMGGAPVSASYLTTAADPTLTAEVVLTATQTELNYVSGVTSALQTQLNNKQASDAGLTSLAALPTAADKIAYSTAADTWAETAITAAGRALIDDADAAAQLTTLGAAPLASPTFTGTPAAPTAANGTNTTQIATTAFVLANATGVGAGARVRRTTNQSITASTITAISFDTEVTDTATMVDIAGQPTRITVTATGGYIVGWALDWATSVVGTRICTARIDGTISVAGLQYANVATYGGPVRMCGTEFVALTAGAYVELVVYQDSGGALNILGEDGTSFNPVSPVLWVARIY